MDDMKTWNNKSCSKMTMDTESDRSDEGDENETRGNWTGKMDFILSCLSYAVGLGNLWRFPYLCYRNGGGAFLIPYVFMLVFAGIPLFFMELSFGQFASEGVISIWKICPLMQGIGWGMFIVSSLIGMYYNMIIAWSLFYLFASFNSHVPWNTCDGHWNTEACSLVQSSQIHNCTHYNGTWLNHTCVTGEEAELLNFTMIQTNETESEMEMKAPSDEYFHNHVLGISAGLHDVGTVRWQLVLSLLGAWVLVAGCLIKGIKSQGKVVYFTATFPYLVLCVLLVRGLTLPGAYNGIMFYLTPEWHRLTTAKVWGDAAVQIFFSLSPCWGGLITLASYNKFNNNCFRDAMIVSVGNCFTSFFAGFVIFAIIGFMAFEMDLSVGEVAKQGAGLAFIIYPEVVSRLPISPLWAILFFAMLVTLGLGTQFSTVVTIHTTLLDVFSDTLRVGRRPSILMILICIMGFLAGLVFCTEAGMYIIQLIDNYAATYSLLIIGLFECLTIAYVYGVDQFMKDIEMMIGYKPSVYWKYMWKFVTPSLLVMIMIFTWIDYVPSKYGDYHYPVWADIVGWVLTMSSVSAIPIVAIINILRADSTLSLYERIKLLAHHTDEWGPASAQQNKNMLKVNHDTRIPLNGSTSNFAITINGNDKLTSCVGDSVETSNTKLIQSTGSTMNG